MGNAAGAGQADGFPDLTQTGRVSALMNRAADNFEDVFLPGSQGDQMAGL